jgi:hypothetical protein
MSDLSTFWGMVASQIVLLILVGLYAGHMAELNCPSYQQFQQIVYDNPYEQTTPINALTNIWVLLGAVFSGCTGIPWWIYMIVFVPTFIAIIVYVVPFIGS